MVLLQNKKWNLIKIILLYITILLYNDIKYKI